MFTIPLKIYHQPKGAGREIVFNSFLSLSLTKNAPCPHLTCGVSICVDKMQVIFVNIRCVVNRDNNDNTAGGGLQHRPSAPVSRVNIKRICRHLQWNKRWKEIIIPIPTATHWDENSQLGIKPSQDTKAPKRHAPMDYFILICLTLSRFLYIL